jgi:hypothetical protein
MLSVYGMYSDDCWIMIWGKRLWPNQDAVSEFICYDWGRPRKSAVTTAGIPPSFEWCTYRIRGLGFTTVPACSVNYGVIISNVLFTFLWKLTDFHETLMNTMPLGTASGITFKFLAINNSNMSAVRTLEVWKMLAILKVLKCSVVIDLRWTCIAYQYLVPSQF